MVVIWGLDLRDIHWSKFKSSYMWNRDYHLRRTKFIVYQLAMILCVCSESVGTAALAKYVDQQQDVERLHSPATVHNDDFVGAASYNIFVGIYVATIFGSGFFFDLFFPERRESSGVRLAWKICSVLACIFAFSDALTLTIITATRSAYVRAPSEVLAQIALHALSPPLRYRDNGRAIASVVLVWPGFVATVASTFIMFASLSHDDLSGPKSTHVRLQEIEAQKRIRESSSNSWVGQS